MITDFFGVIINFIWGILTLEWEIDGFTFHMWQFYAFLLLMVVIYKQLMKTAESGGNK